MMKPEFKVTYVPKKKRNEETENKALNHVKKLMKTEYDRFNIGLNEDFMKILNKNTFYLPNFLCETIDLTLFNALKRDVDSQMEGIIIWNKHFKHEDPTFSETFKQIVRRMSDYFNVEVLASRLNYYKDGNDWKTFHKDSHAYNNGQKEDFTMGASFGATRALEFKYDKTGSKFSFPQHNGDIFAFTSVVNDQFMHGVPKMHEATGPRFSIIAWGRRRDK